MSRAKRAAPTAGVSSQAGIRPTRGSLQPRASPAGEPVASVGHLRHGRSRGAITLAVIFANELLTAGATVADRMFTLNRERLGIPCGPHGEILDIDSVPPIDRERLTQIRVEIGDGLFQGVGDALAEQPPEYLVSRGGLGRGCRWLGR
jgi:hypothetical protein